MFYMSAEAAPAMPAAAVCLFIQQTDTEDAVYAQQTMLLLSGARVCSVTGLAIHQVLSVGKKQHQLSLLLPSPASMACCSSSPGVGMS